MQRSSFSHVLWRTLGSVFGVAVLISVAFALSRVVSVTGITLA